MTPRSRAIHASIFGKSPLPLTGKVAVKHYNSEKMLIARFESLAAAAAAVKNAAAEWN